MKGGKITNIMAKKLKEKKKKGLKVLSSVLLGFLLMSSGVFAMSDLDSKISQTQFQENLKVFEKSPERFLQTQDLGLKDDFNNLNVNLGTVDDDEEYFLLAHNDLDEKLGRE